MKQRTVLVVDDERAIRDMLRMALELVDFRCLEAATTRDAYRLLVDEKPDLMLLDWMLPGGSGMELLHRLKRSEDTRNLPVIMLTAKTAEANIIQGLEAGADDYISKPFAPRELIARIKALVRRSGGDDEDTRLEVMELVLERGSKRVFLAGELLSMGPTEFRLLQFFMTHAERAYTRSQLLERVWGAGVYLEERTVDAYIRRLRKALQTPAINYGHLIQTVRGTGYRFSRQSVS